MSRADAFLRRLEDTSDWLSPIVVKEVRQIVRGREFTYSFCASLFAGLAVAFFGAADALTGSGTTGRWTFSALMGCLTFLGLVVVPLGAFSALRFERMEQTLDLITLTALSPRRVIIGKLLAQAVKLLTFFAGMAPFIAMSFLLGGIDFFTILLSLLVLFMWSLWASAASLFLSSLLKSRAMMGLVFGGAALVLFLIFGLGRILFFFASRGVFFGPAVSVGVTSTPSSWVLLAITTTFCVMGMINLVLLAENRLSLPTEDRVTALRVGFFLQFLLIAGWTLSFVDEGVPARNGAVQALAACGGWHLAVVALFTVTEDLVVPRRVLLRVTSASRWQWLLAMFRPGGGRGAIYVLVQMALLLFVAWLFRPTWHVLRWFATMCAYVCFFTGVPVLAYRLLRPGRAAAFRLRIAVVAGFCASLILPDVVYYLLWQPPVLDLSYSARHLLNPIRTLANWNLVETRQWSLLPYVLGGTGIVAYLALIQMGATTTAEAAATDPHSSAAVTREPGSANVLY